MREQYVLKWCKKIYRNWKKTSLRLELSVQSRIFFLLVLSSSNTLGSIQVCCHQAWMGLHIPCHNQRKLPCASLFFHTSTISTPSLLLCKKSLLTRYPLTFTPTLINSVPHTRRVQDCSMIFIGKAHHNQRKTGQHSSPRPPAFKLSLTMKT